MEASKLKLPKTSPLASHDISSLLLDPHSLALALFHSDSSISLLSLSHLSLSSLPQPQTLITSPTSSSTFLALQNPNRNTLFVVSSPLHGGAAVLLRFWVLTKSSQFTKATVSCNQKGLEFDDSKLGVVFNVPHGASIKLFGSVNVFAMYSVVSNKIWVFTVKMVGNGVNGVGLKLMRCAVIECFKPVFSISLDFGFLVLGEESGVRVFRLRPLVKGRLKKHTKENMDYPHNGKKLWNGVNRSNGYLEGKSRENYGSAKLKSVKLNQDSKEYGSCFVKFEDKAIENKRQTKEGFQVAKAGSIQALSPDKFLVLDSTGDLHLMCLSNTGLASETPFTMKQLPNTMKIQKLAVLPGIPTKPQYIWISDGYHTVYSIACPGVDVSDSESSSKQSEDQLIQSSVSQAIFTSEKIQWMVPLAPNAVLVLGQGSLFVYSIS